MPREGHDAYLCLYDFKPVAISIHVPREGHDTMYVLDIDMQIIISIHVPREGHDGMIQTTMDYYKRFQSTCPARGTTANRPHFFC